MRWTQSVCKTSARDAYGEVVWPRCWRQTAQVHSCAATVAKEPFTGESTK